jgi:hypothetical protein
MFFFVKQDRSTMPLPEWDQHQPPSDAIKQLAFPFKIIQYLDLQQLRLAHLSDPLLRLTKDQFVSSCKRETKKKEVSPRSTLTFSNLSSANALYK